MIHYDLITNRSMGYLSYGDYAKSVINQLI